MVQHIFLKICRFLQVQLVLNIWTYALQNNICTFELQQNCQKFK